MNTIEFLEKLANYPRFHSEVDTLINNQPEIIKQAFLANDIECFKKQISNEDFFANEIEVVKI